MPIAWVRLKPAMARNIRGGCWPTTWDTSLPIDTTWIIRRIDEKVGRSAQACLLDRQASLNQPSSCQAVKLFNMRVKGTEKFWSIPGVESVLSLRAIRLSQDAGEAGFAGRWARSQPALGLALHHHARRRRSMGLIAAESGCGQFAYDSLWSVKPEMAGSLVGCRAFTRRSCW